MSTGRLLYDYWSGNSGPAGPGAAAGPAGADPPGSHGALRPPRLRGRAGRGNRGRGRGVEGHGVRVLRDQGRPVPGRLSGRGPVAAGLPGRAARGPHGRFLRGPAALDPGHPPPHPRGLDPLPVTLIGNYCAGLQLRREITQFLAREDPYGTAAFVRFGIERGEVRRDIDPRMIVSMVDWLMDRVQDAMVTEELDPGLFGYRTQPAAERDRRGGEVLELLRSAVAAR